MVLLPSCPRKMGTTNVNRRTRTNMNKKAAMAKTSFQLPERPPNSPDLVPIEYRLFRKVKRHLRGKRLSLDNDVL